MSKPELSELEKLVIKIQQAGQDWIDSRLTADQLDKDEKNFLAALINDLEQRAGEKMSEAKLERLARGCAEFRGYVTRMCVAKADADRKKVRYENLQALFDAQRSHLAFEREKISKGIFHTGG